MSDEIVECGFDFNGESIERVTAFELHEHVSAQNRLIALVTDTERKVNAERLLGQCVSFWFGHPSQPREFFGGVVDKVTPQSSLESRSQISIEVVDPFSIRCLCHAYRAFENRSVLEMVRTVLRFNHLTVNAGDESPLVRSRIQFGETDWEFVSRLLEEYGYFYYFDGTSMVVRSNSTVPTRGTVALSYSDGRLRALGLEHKLVPLKQRTISYQHETEMRFFADFDPPGGGTAGKSASTAFFGSHANATPLPPLSNEEVEQQARLRSERATAETSCGSGRSTSITIRPALTLQLTDLPRSQLNGNYFVTSVQHVFMPDQDGGAPIYRNCFTCLPASTRYLPPLRTPRAIAHGVHLGAIVAPSEGVVDDLNAGRVRISLYWMGKEGLRDPICLGFSCWARTVQMHAGNGHGSYFQPELGDEVLVAFENGNPDQPYVLGSLYTGKRHPHLPSPADHINQFKVITTRSGNSIVLNDDGSCPSILLVQSRDGTKLNEIRLTSGSDTTIEMNSQGAIRVVGTGSGPISLIQKDGCIEIDSNGKVTIKGSEIVLEASGSIASKAGDELVLKAAKIKLN